MSSEYKISVSRMDWFLTGYRWGWELFCNEKRIGTGQTQSKRGAQNQAVNRRERHIKEDK